MSLAEHIRKQEERRLAMEARLNELAAEYVEHKEAASTVPKFLMDATGEYRQHYFDDWTYTTVTCQATGVRAWTLHSKQFGKALFYADRWHAEERCLAITTDGRLLATEAVASKIDSTYGGTDFVSSEGLNPNQMLVYAQAGGGGNFQEERLQEWPEKRAREQYNILIQWAQRAHIEGLDKIILPIEHAMLRVYNSNQLH